MTKQVQLNSQEEITVSGWTELFPNVDTVTNSTKFVKKLTALIFSTTTYMRGIFPENAYVESELGGRKLKVLTGSYTNQSAYLMINWLKSAFEALEHNYMRQLIFEILDEKNNPIEYYTIEYSYSDDGVKCSLTSGSNNDNHRIPLDKEKLQQETTSLIHTLLTITEDLKPLPKKHALRFKVTYHEGTPDDYIPKYFTNQSVNDMDLLPMFKRKTFGKVDTPFHSVLLKNGSLFVQEDTENNELFPTPASAVPKQQRTSAQLEFTTNSLINSDYRTDSQESRRNNSPRKKSTSKGGKTLTVKINDQREENPDQSKSSDFEWNENQNINKEINVNCVCSSLHIQGDMFECTHCGSWQHYICYKRKPGTEEPQNACCVTCAKLNPNIECTDKSFTKLNASQTKAIAIYRLMLYQCWDNKTFNPKSFMKYFQITPNIVEELVEKLVLEKLLKRKKNSSLFQVNKKFVNKIMNQYFTDNWNNN